MKLVVALMLLLSPITFAQGGSILFGQRKPKKTKTPPAPTELAVPEQRIQTDDGSLLFTNLYIRKCAEFMMTEEYLQGIVVNDSPHTWDNLWIRMSGVTSTDPDRLIDLVDLRGLRPHERRSLGREKCGISLLTVPNDLRSWSFKIEGGSYQTGYSLTMTKPTPQPDLRFEDDRLMAFFVLTGKSLGVAIKNKSDQVIRIDWNQAAYVDPGGKSHPITHEGIKYAEAASSKPPTVIPPNARIEDSVLPVDHIKFGSSSWLVEDLLPAAPEALRLQGKDLSLYLPIEIGGKTVEYVFTFKIAAVGY